MKTRRSGLPLALGTAVGIVFLALSLRGTSLGEIASALHRANIAFSLPVIAMLAIFCWTKAVRWRLLVLPLSSAVQSQLLPPVMVGMAANIVFPAQLGEFIRTHLAARVLRVRYVSLLATIVVERMLDFLTVLLLVGLVLIFGGRSSPYLIKAGYFIGAMGIAISILAVAYTVRTDLFIRFCRKATVLLPPHWQDRIVTQVEVGADGVQAIKSPRLLVGLLTTSFIQWSSMAVCAFLAICAVGIEAPVSAGFVVLAFTVVGLTLPSSPGYFGTIQLCFTLALRPYGVDAASAFAASVYFHVLIYTPILLAGLYYLHRAGYTLRQVQQVDSTTGDDM